MVAYMEGACGIGMVIGPALGSALFAIGGYKFIFFSTGTFYVVSSFAVKQVLNDKFDAMTSQSQSEVD